MKRKSRDVLYGPSSSVFRDEIVWLRFLYLPLFAIHGATGVLLSLFPFFIVNVYRRFAVYVVLCSHTCCTFTMRHEILSLSTSATEWHPIMID